MPHSHIHAALNSTCELVLPKEMMDETTGKKIRKKKREIFTVTTSFFESGIFKHQTENGDGKGVKQKTLGKSTKSGNVTGLCILKH